MSAIPLTKSARQQKIVDLLTRHQVRSQTELAELLAIAGVHVTQATLSRDLRSLGVGKRPGPGGKPVYQLPGPASETLDRERQLIDLKAFVNEVRIAQNLALVRTPPGHANGVARAIDMLAFGGLVGSVAGDDTVLVVMHDHATALRFKRHLESLAARTNGVSPLAASARPVSPRPASPRGASQ
jgi:transcriptional regulator of arginine metabolism